VKPAIPLTDPRFAYVPAHQSDIRKTFERVRAEQEQARAQSAKVAPIRKTR